mgnify:CR=1 FL=1
MGTDILIGHAEASSSTPLSVLPPPPAEQSSLRRPDALPVCRRTRRRKSPCRSRRRPGHGRAGVGLQAAPDRRLGAALARRLRLPIYGPVVVHRTRSARRARVSAGTTARTSSPRSARRSSRSPTAPSSRSAGTNWAAIGSGFATDQGNQFYYAHLSAYSPLAVDGREVTRRRRTSASSATRATRRARPTTCTSRSTPSASCRWATTAS